MVMRQAARPSVCLPGPNPPGILFPVVSRDEILTPLSVEEYLEREKRSDVRHEFIEGYLYAMVGASRRHNLIALSIERMLHAALRGTPCRAFVSDLKVQVGERFFYPDVVVSCSGPRGLPRHRCGRLDLTVCGRADGNTMTEGGCAAMHRHACDFTRSLLPDVRWSPLRHGLGAPRIAGRGWKPIARG